MAYDNNLYKEYLGALKTEISMYKGHPDAQRRKITAVYFGGGTGSMLKPGEVSELLSTMSSVFSFDEGVEITVECHPNTVSDRKFADYRKAGVNRVSLGIQSFQDENLKLIGRNHSAEKNQRVLYAAMNAGFKSVAMDLMYRLPRQTTENLLYDLEYIQKLQPDSISAYSLEPENTPLEKAFSEMPTELDDRAMFYLVGDFLEANGYQRFMQPDFAKQGKESKYVVNAWRAPQQLLLAFGAGANTHYFGGHTYTNIYPIDAYIQAVKEGFPPIIMGVQTDLKELMARYMVLGVRAIRVNKDDFRNLFGQEIQEVFNSPIQDLISLGWLRETPKDYELTKEGIYFVDNISKFFYTEANRDATQPWLKNLYNLRPKKLYGERTHEG